MSQINVTSELVFKKDRAIAEMRAMETEVRGIAQRMSATTIKVSVDKAQIKRDLFDVTKDIERDWDFAIPVRFDSAKAVAELQKTIDGFNRQKIVIPVQMGGASSPSAGSGGPSGVASATASAVGASWVSAMRQTRTTGPMMQGSSSVAERAVTAIERIVGAAQPSNAVFANAISRVGGLGSYEGGAMGAANEATRPGSAQGWDFEGEVVNPRGALPGPAVTRAPYNRADAIMESSSYGSGDTASIPDAAEAGGGLFKGILSRRGMMSGLIAIHGLTQLADAIQLGDESGINEMSDPMAQGRERRRRINLEHSGLRGAVNWVYGKVGLQPTYDSEIASLDDANRQSQAVDRRGIAAQQYIPLQQRMQDAKTLLSGGEFAVQRQQLDRQILDMEKTAREAGGGTISQARQAEINSYASGQRAAITFASARQSGETVIAEHSAEIAGQVADLVTSGRGREASLLAQKSAIDTGLSSERNAVDTEADPAKRKQLQDRYNADFAAGEKQKTAIQAEEDRKRQQELIQSQDVVNDSKSRSYIADLQTQQKYHESSVAQETEAIDRRLRASKEEVDAETDPVRKQQLAQQYAQDQITATHEKQLVAAREMQRIADQTAEHLINMNRSVLAETTDDYELQTKIFNEEWDRRIAKADASDKKMLQDERDAQNKAREAAHKEDQSDQLQRDRNLVLRAQGRGNLADELDIEDRLKRGLRRAGGDPNARNLAIANARAELFSFLRGEQRPQIFGSFESFDASMQEQVFNRDATAVRRAMNLNRFIGQNAKGLSSGQMHLPGENDPFAELKEGSQTFSDAVDRFVNNGREILVVKY